MTSAHYAAIKYCSVCNGYHYPGAAFCAAGLLYEFTVGRITDYEWTCSNCGQKVSGWHSCPVKTWHTPYVNMEIEIDPPLPQQGWQCPMCKTVYAPSVTECDCEKKT